MHIGIDARMIGTKHGGIGRYIFELVKRIPSLDPRDQYAIFVKPDSELPPLSQNVKVVRTDIHWYTLAEQIKFPALLARHPVDLMHFPHWNMPISYNKPFVVTIHDLILKHFPSRETSTLSAFRYFLKKIAYDQVLEHAARKSQHILTVSEFSRQDIHETLDISLQKISAFHLGLAFERPETSTQAHLPYPYVLAVGVNYPHKKLNRIIRVMTDLQGMVPHHLVIAGPRGPFSHLIQETDRVHFIPSPSDRELKNLYAGADVLLFPSEYEGFGLPPLEAQACGIPVIANAVTAMPEILGDSALLIEPTDESWHDAILTVLTNNSLKETLIQKGFENIKRFSFDTLASSTHNLYHQIVKKGV